MYCDSLTHGSRQLQFLIDLIGVDLVMLGCDYPFDMGDPQPVRTMEKTVTEEKARAMIGGDTAARLLGIARV
jgi:aminocarboxymuconate-semialdehyde decarboxylase